MKSPLHLIPAVPYQPLCIPFGDGHKLLNPWRITRVESADKYVLIYCRNIKRPYMVSWTMETVLSKLPADLFMKVHRCHIVSIYYIDTLNKTGTRINHSDNNPIPVGETYLAAFHERIGFSR